MNTTKRAPKLNPKGPENEFKGKLPKANPFEPGSFNTIMKPKKSDTSLILTIDAKEHFNVPDIDFRTSFDISDNKFSILIGRLDRIGEGLSISGAVELISDPETIQTIAVNRIEYIREQLRKNVETLPQAEALVKHLKNLSPNDTQPDISLEEAEGRVDSARSQLHARIRKIEILKEALSEGTLTHILHVSGSAVVSSTHALLSISQSEITFVPLYPDWGRFIDPQNLHILMLGHAKPPHDMNMSIQLK